MGKKREKKVYGSLEICSKRLCTCTSDNRLCRVVFERPLMHNIAVSLCLSRVGHVCLQEATVCYTTIKSNQSVPPKFIAENSLKSVNADFPGELIISKEGVTVSCYRELEGIHADYSFHLASDIKAQNIGWFHYCACEQT